ncbi:unnamed protein product, partial [Durusdinium trenchii]
EEKPEPKETKPEADSGRSGASGRSRELTWKSGTFWLEGLLYPTGHGTLVFTVDPMVADSSMDEVNPDLGLPAPKAASEDRESGRGWWAEAEAAPGCLGEFGATEKDLKKEDL